MAEMCGKRYGTGLAQKLEHQETKIRCVSQETQRMEKRR